MTKTINFYVILSALAAVTDAIGEHSEGLFSYDMSAANGPSEWYSLDLGDTDNACNGTKQSGIDILTGSCTETDANYKFEPGDCTVDDLTFTISDHSIQATYNASICNPPRMTIPNVSATYEVLQFHFHTGSEHALDGEHFGGEIHVVHQEVGGEGLAVLGMFVEPTSFDDTHYFDALISKWEEVANETLLECGKNETDVAVTQGLHRRSLVQKEPITRNAAESFNPYSLVPEGSTYYFYSGSLTTPPCTEIVSWNVVDKPISLSVAEYRVLVDLVLLYKSPETCSLATVAAPSGETSRPTQPINGRTITHKCPTGTELQFNESQEQSSSEIFTTVRLVMVAAWMTSILLIQFVA